MSQYTILHTIDTTGPGGAETVVFNLATRLDPRRFRSIALLPPRSWLGDKLREHGVPTFCAEGRVWYDLRLPRTIARVIREQKVDLVHSHLPDQNFYTCLAGRLTRCRTLVTYHGPVELSTAKQLRARTKLFFVRHSATAVVVVCDFVGEILQKLGFPASKLVRIYNGISVKHLDGSQRMHLKEELGLRNDAKLIGMVANIRQSKGYEYFIRAAKQVCAADPNVHFVAVGDIDQELAQPLWSLLEELKLRDRVHFLGFREDVPEILEDLDVFVLSSTSEGFPLVLLEAMAAGKPVVATRCGGPQEVLSDTRTGYLVPVADAQELAARISELLAQPEHAAALGANARTRVQAEFSVEQMIATYERLYERVLETS
jgi:glycosyltransferase involved in cell wall biosynthesis